MTIVPANGGLWLPSEAVPALLCEAGTRLVTNLHWRPTRLPLKNAAKAPGLPFAC
ncbi:hypothetical protein [Acetobacter okinawensis]|uniref:hypothetical protein n=1 Tax=Acetobacter okinawensis TaxID=1076594 RepID=UPI000B25C606|nr:hypothetical protein [Acetobacter okinawensis]